MPRISEFRNNRICIGDSTGPAGAQVYIQRVSLDTASGAPTAGPFTDADANAVGSDLQMSNAAGAVTGEFKAEKIWNAVWNDLADFQALDDRLEFGRVYYDTPTGAKICNTRCQQSVMGIASDTFGFAVGSGNPSNNGKEVPIAVAGWTLAYVDQEYEPGTALTNDASGALTKISFWEKLCSPERIVAIYKKRETAQEFGSSGKKIKVNGRHWVRVR